MRASVLLFLVFAAVSASASAVEPPDTGNLHYADLLQATAKFDEVIVWEGLPHHFEKTSRANELRTKENFSIGDEAFYSLPLPFKDDEKAAVSDAVLKHIENFKAWSGFKLCGGFHADYAVEWRLKGKTLAQVLICFSCHEAQFRAGDRIEQVDQSDEGNKQFRALLLAHRQQRPAFQLDGAKPPMPPAEKMTVPKMEAIGPPAMPPPSPPKPEIFAQPNSAPAQKPE